MKLYYVPGTCSLAPHILLREADLSFELDRVDRQTKITASGEDYNAINPKGYVPALRLDDGQLLTEAAVLLEYIADRRPQLQLIAPFGTLERYRLQEWLNFAATELHRGYSQLFPDNPEEVKAPIRQRLMGRLGFVSKALEGRPYLMGETLTAVDPYLFAILRWSDRVKIHLGDLPPLQAFFKRVRGRPAVAAALQMEGLS